ncbi:MAG: transglutaminase domain-containing protein [Chitinophagaceae bacterium]
MLLRAPAQKKASAYSKNIAEQTSPYLLSQKLTRGLPSEKAKVTSILGWITDNIAYNTGILYAIPRKAPIIYPDLATSEPDTLTPLNDYVAENVLRRRVAVCDGYARLFASLCFHAGIKAELVTGYVRTDKNRAEKRFRSNHTWNAVRIDSSWHLLDATWASGYVTYGSNQFVTYYNPRYIFAPPAEFIKDHYPEDLRWTLLDKAPALPEFAVVPFRYQAFLKFRITAFAPLSGTIDATPGDTISIEMQTDLKEKSLVVTSQPISDSLLLAAEKSSQSGMVQGDKVVVSHVVGAGDGEWLHVLYNGEPVLRYRLRLKQGNLLSYHPPVQ